MGENLSKLGVGTELLDRTQKSLIIKEKKLINQTKFKTLYFQKTPLRK